MLNGLGIWCQVIYAFIGTCRAALWSGSAQCSDVASCKSHVMDVRGKLGDVGAKMQAKHLALEALEDLRTGLLSGERVPIASDLHQQLEGSSSLLGDAIFDVKHTPAVDNITKHLMMKGTVAEDLSSPIRRMMLMPVKKFDKKGASAVLTTVDSANKLHVHTLNGDKLFGDHDLGIPAKRRIEMLEMSLSQDNPHVVVTGDDTGEVRVTELKVGPEKKSKDSRDEGGEAARKLIVKASEGATFQLPQSELTGDTAPRKLTALLPVERGAASYLFALGDDQGGVSIFNVNGTRKGRTKVTQDKGGIIKLAKAQGAGTQVLFLSAYSFGFVQLKQVDMEYPACTGWASPAVGVSVDPTHPSGRVLVSLANGDVLVYATGQGSSQSCELAFKFPKVSSVPLNMRVFRNYAVGIPAPQTAEQRTRARELFVMNMQAMEGGYSAGISRAVTLRVPFEPRIPAAFSMHNTPDSGARAWVAMLFEDGKAVELYELNLKKIPSVMHSGGGGGDGGGAEDILAWVGSVPKIVYFLVILIPIVMWNVRKGTQKAKAKRSEDAFDNVNFNDKAELQRLLRERKEKKTKEGGAKASAPAPRASAGLDHQDDDDDDDE